MIPVNLEVVARFLVVAALAYAVIVATTAWAVRRQHIGPFGVWPKFVRRISDPILRPLERRMVRLGGIRRTHHCGWSGSRSSVGSFSSALSNGSSVFGTRWWRSVTRDPARWRDSP